MTRFDKPEIAMSRETGTTYWTLSYTMKDGGSWTGNKLYELRVRYDGLGEEFKLFYLNRSEHDDLELVSKEDYAERRETIAVHEPHACHRHAGDPPHDDEPCQECRAASLNYADAMLADKVRPAERVEEKVGGHLRETWNAFRLLFNPVYTL
jgi:hypothetical protein